MLRIVSILVALALLAAGYFGIFLNWNYSTGERAGWVQKFSRKGWVCKTWEGELTLITMPGGIPEKFLFTVWDDEVAKVLNQSMGKRVALHYNEKVGLPTTCFGDTRYYVTSVSPLEDIPLMPGISIPAPAAKVPDTPAAPAK